MPRSLAWPVLFPFAPPWARFQRRYAQRRWFLWWAHTLSDGHRCQEIWRSADWTSWSRARGSIIDVNALLTPLSDHDGRRRAVQGYSPLCLALRLHDPRPFQELLDAGASVHAPGTPAGELPLDLLRTLGQAFRERRWSLEVAGACPQAWHSVLYMKLAPRTVVQRAVLR